MKIKEVIVVKTTCKTRIFTWSNQRVGATSIFSRLEWFLAHSSLLDGNLIISSKIIPKLSSDHHPIALLFEKEEELGPIPFQFSHFGSKEMDLWPQFIRLGPNLLMALPVLSGEEIKGNKKFAEIVA